MLGKLEILPIQRFEMENVLSTLHTYCEGNGDWWSLFFLLLRADAASSPIVFSPPSSQRPQSAELKVKPPGDACLPMGLMPDTIRYLAQVKPTFQELMLKCSQNLLTIYINVFQIAIHTIMHVTGNRNNFQCYAALAYWSWKTLCNFSFLKVPATDSMKVSFFLYLVVWNDFAFVIFPHMGCRSNVAWVIVFG